MSAYGRSLLAAATVGAAAGLATGLLLVSGIVGEPEISDTAVYERYGERMSDGDLPYRDFRVEYPPGALPAFVLPALVSASRDGYDSVFACLMITCLAVLGAFVSLSLRSLGASRRRSGVALGALCLGVLLLGPFVLTRFDLLPAAIVAGAVTAFLAGRERLAAGVLGGSIAVKLYPAVLLPLLVASSWRRRGSTAALRDLAISAVVVLAAYVPFVLLSPEGVGRSLWQQLGRPLQIESLGAATLLALHHLFAMPLDWASGHGSQNLTGTVAGVASVVTSLVGAAALVAVWVAFSRGEVSDARFVRFGAAALVAFVAFGKVLSPQFLVWLLPLVCLVAGRRGAVASIMLVAACGLTRLWFPGNYWELVKEFDELSSWLLLARDLLLAGLFLVLVSRVTARGRAPAP